MKHDMTESVPATTRVVLERTQCEICKCDIDPQASEVEKVKAVRTPGLNYPEGANGEEDSVDLCGKCFYEKLVPWLQSQRIKPPTNDWDW